MLHFDRTGELKRRFLLTAVERNRNAQLRVRALQEIAAAKDAEAFDLSIDVIGTWAREERREGTKVMFQALAEKRIGRRDQANAWIWRLAEYTREVHEEYAVQRWPETKRLLGLLVNSSGGAHARNARRLVHAARKQDRRLQAALLAAAVAHTPEAEEVLRGARTRLARKPSALSRELLRNFPKGKGRRSRRRRKKAAAAAGRTGVGAAQTRAGPDEEALDAVATTTVDGSSPDGGGEAREDASDGDAPVADKPASRSRSRRSRRRKDADPERAAPEADAGAEQQPTPTVATASESGADEQPQASADGDAARPARKRRPRRAASAASDGSDGAGGADATSEAPAADGAGDDKPAEKPKPKPRRARKPPAAKKADEDGDGSTPDSSADSPADSPAEAA
jgi:hypothetical protein